MSPVQKGFVYFFHEKNSDWLRRLLQKHVYLSDEKAIKIILTIFNVITRSTSTF